MQVLTLKELKSLVGDGEAKEVVTHVQVDVVTSKTTKDGKPYYEVKFIDAADHVLLRAWSDTPIHTQCAALEKGHCVELSGEFAHHATFGLEARRWAVRPLSHGGEDRVHGRSARESDSSRRRISSSSRKPCKASTTRVCGFSARCSSSKNGERFRSARRRRGPTTTRAGAAWSSTPRR